MEQKIEIISHKQLSKQLVKRVVSLEKYCTQQTDEFAKKYDKENGTNLEEYRKHLANKFKDTPEFMERWHLYERVRGGFNFS